MAVAGPTNSATKEELHRRLHDEREELARSVETLRESLDLRRKIGANLPVVALTVFGAAFVMSGGIGATMRLLARRSREGTTKARFGPFSLVDRD
jgi:hypothetical protein